MQYAAILPYYSFKHYEAVFANTFCANLREVRAFTVR